jgi:hypothetical protein
MRERLHDALLKLELRDEEVARLPARNHQVENELKRVEQDNIVLKQKATAPTRARPRENPIGNVTADLSRYVVVVTIHRGQRPFKWEIWDKLEARPIQSSYQRFRTFREAEAAASEALARRWGNNQAMN